jgi:hypothetical protein
VTPRPSGAQQEESAVSAFDDFEAAYNRLKNAPMSAVRGHLSKTLELICGAEQPNDADVQREARKAIVRIGDAIEDQGLLVMMAMEKSEALPAENREKAREGIEEFRKLMGLRQSESD